MILWRWRRTGGVVSRELAAGEEMDRRRGGRKEEANEEAGDEDEK